MSIGWGEIDQERRGGAPKVVIDNNLVYKIQDDDSEVPRVMEVGASSSQPRIGTTQDKFMHLEAYLQS